MKASERRVDPGEQHSRRATGLAAQRDAQTLLAEALAVAAAVRATRPRPR